MATPAGKDSQTLRLNLLQLIKWRDHHGTVQTLKLYTVLSTMWEKVSDLLMLDPHTRTSIADRHKDKPEKCIRDVIEKWMQDEKSLSPNYKCTWNGLRLLLEDLEHTKVASDLRAALAADVSSFKNNLDIEVPAPPKVKKSERRSCYSTSSRKLIKPFLPYGYCKGTPRNARARDLKFPGINLEELKDEQKEELKITLSEESHSLAMKFIKIRLNFYSYLEEKLMGLMPTIQTYLKEFLVLPPMYGDQQNIEHKVFTSNLTIQDISDFLTQYCSFFNFELLRQIFEGIKYQDGLESLKQHERDLEEYAKRRICHFPSGLGMLDDQSHNVVAVKLDDMYVNCSIRHLLQFHKQLCRILKVTLGQFTLDGLQPGCICIIFHLLKGLYNIVFPLSEEVIQKIKVTKCHTAKIISLSCKTFMFKAEDGDNNSDTTLKLQQYKSQKEGHLQMKKEGHSKTEKDEGQTRKYKEEKHPWKENIETRPQTDMEEGHTWKMKKEEHTRKEKEEKHSGPKMKEKYIWLENKCVEPYLQEGKKVPWWKETGLVTQQAKWELYLQMLEHRLTLGTYKQEEEHFLKEKEHFWQGKEHFWQKKKHPLILEPTMSALLKKADDQASTSTLSIQLDWRRGPDMPVAMDRYVQAVKINDTLFLGGGLTLRGEDAYKVMAFNTQSSEWQLLPPYPTCWFGMTTINSKLVLVGGITRYNISDSSKLGEWQTDTNQWTRPFPPMPTPRYWPSATSYKHWLVVAGGGYPGRRLRSIEVLDVPNMQWSTRPSTPTPWETMKCTTLGDTWYLMGGRCGNCMQGVYVPNVYSISLKALVSQSASDNSNIWRKIPSLDCTQSCPLIIRESLLAVGGYEMSSDKPVSTIQRYVPDTDTWVNIGVLPFAGVCNTCIMTPDEVYVLGDNGHTYIARVL